MYLHIAAVFVVAVDQLMSDLKELEQEEISSQHPVTQNNPSS